MCFHPSLSGLSVRLPSCPGLPRMDRISFILIVGAECPAIIQEEEEARARMVSIPSLSGLSVRPGRGGHQAGAHPGVSIPSLSGLSVRPVTEGGTLRQATEVSIPSLSGLSVRPEGWMLLRSGYPEFPSPHCRG